MPFILFVATVLTVYGIETRITHCLLLVTIREVATVLTVYGIETKLQCNIPTL